MVILCTIRLRVVKCIIDRVLELQEDEGKDAALSDAPAQEEEAHRTEAQERAAIAASNPVAVMIQTGLKDAENKFIEQRAKDIYSVCDMDPS